MTSSPTGPFAGLDEAALRALDQALQHATTEMAAWMTSDYRLSASGAAHLLGQVVRYEVGNVFNPAYTMICSVEKKWLPKLT